MDFIIARLREPSTYAGLSALLAGMSFLPNAAEWADVVLKVGAGIAGIFAILMPERK